MSNKVYRGVFTGLLLFLAVISGAAATPADQDKQKKILIIADFESGEERNNVDGGYFGVWERNSNENIRGCQISFFELGRKDSAYCLKLKYDVGPPNSPYAGFWLLFDDLDLNPYKKLSFWARGDKKAGYTRYFKVEFKNDNETGFVITPPIAETWQRIEIPLSKFNINDWTKITEFVIVFEDKEVSKKKGAIYIDDIAVEK